MREEEAQTRATSSMTMTVASASAPAPPYASGTWTACRSVATSASQGLLREAGLLVHLGGERRDLRLGEGAHRVPEHVVLFGRPVQVEVSGGALPDGAKCSLLFSSAARTASGRVANYR